VRGDLPVAFKARVTEVLQNLDLSALDPADRKIMVGAGITQLVPQTDRADDKGSSRSTLCCGSAA